MNQLFGQPADPVRSGGANPGPSSVSVPPLPVGGAERVFFHLDIKRSLQLHWRLARNVAIAGFVLGVLYFLSQALVFKTWPSYQADSVVRNSLLIILAGLLLGILAAVVAHKLDPRVYIAKDVELILGFPPMAQLPDFSEVSDGMAEEYLLRLASSIEHARKQSNLRSCVFTGASSGAGVSTLVNRVLEMLDAMGRPTMLVDATGAPAPAPRDRSKVSGDAGARGLVDVERVIRPTALLQQMAEETETQDESLVLTDTAPLAVSAETEYLVRFVDCAIVVIESGKTTRRELREVAATLQRLDVGAVGFVLNRVGLAKADPAFRLSVEAIEKHLQSHSSIVARRTRRSKSFASEEPGDSDVLPNDATRALFEPGLAAAAAAVARFSSRAVSEPPACLPSPMIFAPGDESTKRFSVPLTSKPMMPFSPSRLSAPAEKTAEGLSSPLASEQEAPISPPMASAPFVEAARHFSSPEAAEPEATFSSATASTPFGDVARYSSTQSAAEPEIPTPSPTVSEPFAEARKRSASPEDAEPVVADARQVVSGLTDSDWLWAVPEQQPIETAAAASPVGEPEPTEKHEATQPAANPDSDVPWWLRITNRRPEPTRAPVLWQPARVWVSQKPDTAPEPRSVGPNVNPGQPVGAAATASGERVPAGYNAPGLEAVPQEMREFEVEEAPVTLTSRLSGLRNLLFVLGVKDSHAAEEQPDRRPGTGTNLDPSGERPTSERTISQEKANAAPINIGGASPRLVTAHPEFLPPKAIVINVDKEDAHAGESSTRQDRRAASDGIEILPSRRGQYKRI